MSLAELWFFVIAGLWSTYLVLEGFDFGVGMMMGVAARNEDERSEMIETIRSSSAIISTTRPR